MGKAFEKQIKNKKQTDALKDLKLKHQTKSTEGIFPTYYESDEIKNEVYKIKRYQNEVIRDNV